MFDFTIEDMEWKEQTVTEPRFRTYFDYGVRRVNDSFVLKTSVCSEAVPMFHGIPVKFSDYVTREVIRRKRWKRLGRPDKVRVRTIQAPAIIILDEAKFRAIGSDRKHPVVIMHTKLKHLVRESSCH